MNASIKAISYYLPEEVLTNEHLVEIYDDWTAEKIFEKTGIRNRHITRKGETALDLAQKSVEKLFFEFSISPDNIDFIILATQSPDYILPTTACLLQDRLGIPCTAGAIDINLGCSAYIYGIALSKSLIVSGIAKNILLVMTETYSKHIHPKDKSVRTIFGDGAAASLISRCEEENILKFIFGTDGSGAQNLIIPASGTKIEKTSETKLELLDDTGSIRNQENLFMNGPEIFNFTIKTIPKAVNECLLKNGESLETIDLYVFHQANKYMLDYLRKKIKIPAEKFYVNLEETGNTVSASIPIALKMAEQEGKLQRGSKVMLVGFGVGLSWGATIIKW